MSADERNGRSTRPHTAVHRVGKAGLALLALFVVGVLSAGALAEVGPLAVLTGSSSSSTETSTATTGTNTTGTTSTSTSTHTTT